MKRTIITALLYTVVTAVLLGLVYPLIITGIAQALFPAKANGQLMVEDGQIRGSRILGQPFTGPGYFHSRPSAAGYGYDAASSSGSNLGPTSKSLVDRVTAATTAEKSIKPVPIDLVTASASGLDPDITPEGASFQIARVAAQRHLTEAALQDLVSRHVTPRQFGLLGEPRVNVLLLNRDLDQIAPVATH